MSHQPERKEKNCLNCGTEVVGRYCHVCGQENIETKESFLGLTKHFVYDVIHFDGNFFHTLFLLFKRPGKVAKEYCQGKRASYLHPIRMYLFTSAVFFLVFFSTKKADIIERDQNATLTSVERTELINEYKRDLKKDPNDTVAKRALVLLQDSSKTLSGRSINTLDQKQVFSMAGHYKSVHEYDSTQKTLPEAKRDGWFIRAFRQRAIKFNHEYEGRADEGIRIFWEDFLHKLPYVLFMSLPFFAFILKLLYIRRKNFYYSDHAVFTLYHYVFTFILLLLTFGVTALQSVWKSGLLTFLYAVLLLAWPVYLFMEMRYFYGQSRKKTLLKFFLLNFFGIITLLLLFLVFLLLAVFEL